MKVHIVTLSGRFVNTKVKCGNGQNLFLMRLGAGARTLGLKSKMFISEEQGCLEGERISLLQFKKSLVDRSNRLSSWTGLDCCKWKGVSCSSTTGHVLKLDLQNLQATYDDIGRYWDNSYYCNNCLEGEINQSLINLTHLDYLDLSLNNFSAIKIPEFLGSFKNLKYLNLSSSGFVGSIPTHLGNLSSLEHLDIGIHEVDGPNFNNLATNNLDWLFGLSSLRTLDMSGISIGHSENWLNPINKLVSLASLNLAFCNLGTTNPLSHVNSTTALVWLNLYENYLDSTILFWLSNLTSLEYLSLG
ncbi:PREDICTED: leucine-rich repeat receptor-like protein CLAVATA2 [Ipomoea nil]|uniref:leucine-rich repeat receptor-like protein CLAVATA2 n=1 Tax=Ipomoea nil TaxID=35883 RepID=UPI0009017FB8|nr:PREDICTED: leucine-rich repeat receptor-like protein CLAVATA2 [Ipomoea nil]